MSNSFAVVKIIVADLFDLDRRVLIFFGLLFYTNATLVAVYERSFFLLHTATWVAVVSICVVVSCDHGRSVFNVIFLILGSQLIMFAL